MNDDERISLKNRATPPLRNVIIPSDGRIQIESLRNQTNDLAPGDYVMVIREKPVRKDKAA